MSSGSAGCPWTMHTTPRALIFFHCKAHKWKQCFGHVSEPCHQASEVLMHHRPEASILHTELGSGLRQGLVSVGTGSQSESIPWYVYDMYILNRSYHIQQQWFTAGQKSNLVSLFSGTNPVLGSVQSFSCVRLFVTPWTAEYHTSLSITNSQSVH